MSEKQNGYTWSEISKAIDVCYKSAVLGCKKNEIEFEASKTMFKNFTSTGWDLHNRKFLGIGIDSSVCACVGSYYGKLKQILKLI